MYIYKRICTWGILSIVREASEKRGYPVANNDDDYVGRFLGFFFRWYCMRRGSWMDLPWVSLRWM